MIEHTQIIKWSMTDWATVEGQLCRLWVAKVGDEEKKVFAVRLASGVHADTGAETLLALLYEPGWDHVVKVVYDVPEGAAAAMKKIDEEVRATWLN